MQDLEWIHLEIRVDKQLGLKAVLRARSEAGARRFEDLWTSLVTEALRSPEFKSMAEAGDLLQARAEGWSFDRIAGDLHELVTGRAGPRAGVTE